MGGNSEAATRHNLELERISARCTLLGIPAQAMPFVDGSFDVIVSNLCLHNIHDKATRGRALLQIARVLKSGGMAILSGCKHTGEYAQALKQACPLAVFAIKQIAHSPAASLVGLALDLALICIQGAFCYRVNFFRLAARGATIGKTRFIRLQFKLFRAHDTSFYGEGHNAFIVIEGALLYAAQARHSPPPRVLPTTFATVVESTQGGVAQMVRATDS